MEVIESTIEKPKVMLTDEDRFSFQLKMSRLGVGVVDKKLEERRTVWRVHPSVYALERLGVTVTDEQREILDSVRDNRRTAVKAHHAQGKTFVAAISLLWWIDCWDVHIGYITAPTWGQSLRLTFKQAKRLAMKSKLEFEILNTGIIRDKDSFKGTERFIQALNSDSGEGFQGEHTAPILIVKDESTGVPLYIHEAAEGLMTNADCRMLEIANPTDEATQFGVNCESPNYTVLSYSAVWHPNVVAELKGRKQPFPGAISLLWLYEKMRDECEVVSSLTDSCFEFYALGVMNDALNGIKAPKVVRDETGKIDHSRSGFAFYKPSGYFESRVLGEFPTEASTKVIPKGWLNALVVKEINTQGTVQIGCDPARFGDDRTAIFARCGGVVLMSNIVRKFDNLEVAGAIREMVDDVCKMLNKEKSIAISKKDVIIKIDTTGGLGAGPYDILKADHYNVVAVNSSELPNDTEKYLNVRSELWFDIRDRVREKEIDFARLGIDVKRMLIKELSTPNYKINARGKKVVEDKSEIKARLGASPDLADGLCLTFYEGRPTVKWEQVEFRF